MKLKGSCHCQRIQFTVTSQHYYPYQLCYCSICRKTQGGGGFAINLSAEAKTLKVKGKKFLSVYRARLTGPGKKTHKSTGERHFCSVCSSGLWLFDPEWPDLIHPFASAIDSSLPKTPKQTHLMLDFKAPWVRPHRLKRDKNFKLYPKESIAEWHEENVKKGPL